MNLANLCSLSDTYYIAENKAELDQLYYSSSELIFSDGKFDSHIDSDGYIKINNIKDASYIVFVDQVGNLFLAIYRYIQEVKFKDIINHINEIHRQTGMYKHSVVCTDAPKIQPQIKEDLKNGALVDVNNMVCSICGSLEFEEPFRYDQNRNISCTCSKCRTVYYLKPSKYYVVAHKTVYSPNDMNQITRKIEEDK